MELKSTARRIESDTSLAYRLSMASGFLARVGDRLGTYGVLGYWTPPDLPRHEFDTQDGEEKAHE
jgi:hypothetical protein